MKLRSLIIALTVAAAGAAGWYYYHKPVPVVDHRRLAPPGTFFLLDRASVNTPSGVVGFPPGMKVHLVKDQGETLVVTAEGKQFRVHVRSVTNDIDVGELAGKHDARSQQELARIAAQDRATARAAQESEAAQMAEENNRHRLLMEPAASGALNRGSYNERTGVARGADFYYAPADAPTPAPTIRRVFSRP